MENDIFNGAGGFADPSVFAQELVSLHYPDCPDKYQLLDQCAHCGKRPAINNYPYTPVRHGRIAVNPSSQTHWQYEQPTLDPADLNNDLLALPVSAPQQSFRSHALQPHEGAQVGSTHGSGLYIPTHNEQSFDWAALISSPQTSTQAIYNHNVHMPNAGSSIRSQNDAASQVSSWAGSAFQSPSLYDSFSQSSFSTGSSFAATSPYSYPAGPATPARTNRPTATPSEHLGSIVAGDSRNVQNWVQQPRLAGDRSAQPPLPVAQSSNTNGPPPTTSVTSSGVRRTGNQLYDQSYPFPCEVCGKRYSTLEETRKHTRYHRRPYACDQCTDRFSLNKDLKRHKNSVHPNVSNATRAYCAFPTCEYSSKGFPRCDNRNRHEIKTHHYDRRDGLQQQSQ